MKVLIKLVALLTILASVGGCTEDWCWPFDCSSSKSSSGVVDDSSNTTATTTSTSTSTTTDTTSSTSSTPSNFDLSSVKWLHTNVSGWPVTSSLRVSISNGNICFSFADASIWPTTTIRHTSGTRDIEVNANPWVFAYESGQWIGGTFEWMTPTGTCKPTYTVAGDHVKRAPLNGTWAPSSGDTLYFMVSALARFPSITNTQARTDVVKVTWP